MLFGPVFALELLTTARRARYFVFRALYGLLLLAFLMMNASSVLPYDAGRTLTLGEAASFGSMLFDTFAVIQCCAVLMLTPALVAGLVAEARQRKTLGDLLTTPLTSFE